MRISNFKNYVDWKNIKKKIALVAISVAIGSMATGCNQNINSNQYINENNGIYQQLNEEKLDSNTTDINDRADYYEKYVEDKMDKMSESEKLNYYVNVKDFSLMSAKYEYSNSFGCVWVPFSLKIVGEYWWLERNECRFPVLESVSLKQAIG